jgi:hypothetical protein
VSIHKFETLDHFMAMYYSNHDEIPSLEVLIDHTLIYIKMEDTEAVKDLIDELVLMRNLVQNSGIDRILAEYGFRISMENFKLFIDPMIESLNR